jgi:hypothetical protein
MMMQKRANLISSYILLVAVAASVSHDGCIGAVRAFVPSSVSKPAFSFSTSRFHRPIQSLVVSRMAEEGKTSTEDTKKSGDLYDSEVRLFFTFACLPSLK